MPPKVPIISSGGYEILQSGLLDKQNAPCYNPIIRRHSDNLTAQMVLGGIAMYFWWIESKNVWRWLRLNL